MSGLDEQVMFNMYKCVRCNEPIDTWRLYAEHCHIAYFNITRHLADSFGTINPMDRDISVTTILDTMTSIQCPYCFQSFKERKALDEVKNYARDLLQGREY